MMVLVIWNIKGYEKVYLPAKLKKNLPLIEEAKKQQVVLLFKALSYGIFKTH
jgi:hypothetical protein